MVAWLALHPRAQLRGDWGVLGTHLGLWADPLLGNSKLPHAPRRAASVSFRAAAKLPDHGFSGQWADNTMHEVRKESIEPKRKP